MVTEEDIEYVRFCVQNEAENAYESLNELLGSLRLLHYEHTEKYKTLSTAFVELSLITRYGIEVFENNTYEHEHKEKEWWE